jgi:hypothetical protein
LLGFDLDVWDYVTFAAVVVLVAAGTVLVVLIAGLPGRNREKNALDHLLGVQELGFQLIPQFPQDRT